MSIIHDPDAESRSLMNRQPSICDGEKTGIPCAHFWAVIQKFDASNADTMRRGENNRACKLMSGWPLEWVSEEKPTYCNQYEPRKIPGLIALVQRAVLGALFLGPSDEQRAGRGNAPRGGLPLYDGVLGPDPLSLFPGWAKFDRYFNEFKPITEGELKNLREQFPDKPENIFSRGKNPMSMSAADIADAPPIGMLKPGEQVPGSASAQSTSLLNEIFDKKTEDTVPNKNPLTDVNKDPNKGEE